MSSPISSPTNQTQFNCFICHTKVYFTPIENKEENIPQGIFTCSQRCHKTFLKAVKSSEDFKVPPNSPDHTYKKINMDNNNENNSQ